MAQTDPLSQQPRLPHGVAAPSCGVEVPLRARQIERATQKVGHAGRTVAPLHEPRWAGWRCGAKRPKAGRKVPRVSGCLVPEQDVERCQHALLVIGKKLAVLEAQQRVENACNSVCCPEVPGAVGGCLHAIVKGERECSSREQTTKRRHTTRKTTLCSNCTHYELV